METFEFSNRAIRYFSDYRLLYYFHTSDTISLVLADQKMPEIEVLLRNFIDSNTIHYEGKYIGPPKKTKKDYSRWKLSHKHFTKDREWFWQNRGFVPVNQLDFC